MITRRNYARSTTLSTTSTISVPRALEFFNPLAEDFSTHRTRLTFRLSVSYRPYARRPLRDDLFSATGLCNGPSPRFAHQRPSPPCETLFPPQLSDGPVLCHLYFGRDYTEVPPSIFVNTVNFPLDGTRYTQLANFFQFLPLAADVARATLSPPSPSFCRCARRRVFSGRRWWGWFHLFPDRLQPGKCDQIRFCTSLVYHVSGAAVG